MITRQVLQRHQDSINDATNEWDRITTRANYARTLIRELMTLIAEETRIWTANDMEAKLVASLDQTAVPIGGMLPMELFSFQGALRAFVATMETPIDDRAVVALINTNLGVDAVENPEDSWAVTAAAYGNMTELERQPLTIIERSDWVGAQPWAPAPPEPEAP